MIHEKKVLTSLIILQKEEKNTNLFYLVNLPIMSEFVSEIGPSTKIFYVD